MKLFNKQNTVDTKLIYQTFPFANCQPAGNSVLSTPSSNVITNHYNRSILAQQPFGASSSAGGVSLSGHIYYFNTIMVEEEVYGPQSTGSSMYTAGWGANIAPVVGSTPATFTTNIGSPTNNTNGWMTSQPIANNKQINGFKLYNVQNTGASVSSNLDIITYNSITNTFSILSTVVLTPFINGAVQIRRPVLHIPFTLVGDGATHIGFAIRTSDTGVSRDIARAISIINS